MSPRRDEADLFDTYIKQAKKYPVLSRDEEQKLARRAQKGDEQAMDMLVVSNLRFVVSLASRYQNLGIPYMDLISEGNIGLMKAAGRFDPDKNVRFISYARWWIRHYMLKSILSQSDRVNAPEETDGRHGSRETHSCRMVSLDQRFSDSENSETILDNLEDRNGTSPEEDLMGEELTREINKMLDKLKPVEKKVLNWHFGLNGSRTMALREIGAQFSLTKERIRQIEQKALEKLRYPMEDYQVVDFIRS